MKHNDIIGIIQQKTGRKALQREIADALDVPVNTIYSRSARNQEYRFDDIKRIENYFKINIVGGNEDEFAAEYYPDVLGSCGSGTFVLSESKEFINVPKKIVESYSSRKKYSVINAYGDSMSPSIRDGDLLVVENSENQHIRDNRVYVFRYGDKIFVKRLVLNINQLVIKSDNAEYKPITLDLNENTDIQIIGLIVGLMRSM